jgi:hypothetical protein
MAVAQRTMLRHDALTRWRRLFLPLVPLLIGLPVLVALARSVVDLAGLSQPFFGDVSGTSIDAHALTLGSPLYQDPNSGYTPLAYPPLFPLLLAGLDQVRLWTGWPVLVSLLAEGALIALAARLAYRPAGTSPGERALGIAAAIGAGALAWWLVAFVPFNFLYSPRPDQLSWAFAFFGLALVPRAADGSRTGLGGSVLLLSAACWTKQTTAIAPVVALLALLLAASAGRARWRTAAEFAAAMALLNALGFAVLAVATSGWAATFLLEMPGRHQRAQELRTSIRQLGHSTVIAAAFVAWLAVTLALARQAAGEPLRLPARRANLWPESWEGRFALVLALFVVIDVPPSLYFIGASGAAHNVFLGIGWALALLAAAGLGWCATRPQALAGASLGVLALFVVSESAPLQRWLRDHRVLVPPKSLRVLAYEEFPGLHAYAARRTVYHPVFTDLDAQRTGRVYQNFDNSVALLASGYQPGYLVGALLDRRFDVVYLLPQDRRNERDAGTGKWEDNYLWKLNQVMRAKYRPLRPVPRELRAARAVPAGVVAITSPGILERRPGPDPAPWMRLCFGPFRIDGLSWRIARGGGFWCRAEIGSDTMRLVRTRAAVSELRTDGPVSVAGRSVRLALPGTGSVALAGGRGDERWAIRGRTVAGRRLAVRLESGGRLFEVTVPRRETITFAFTDRGSVRDGLRAGPGGRIAATIPRDAAGPLSVQASRASRAAFDLGALRP